MNIDQIKLIANRPSLLIPSELVALTSRAEAGTLQEPYSADAYEFMSDDGAKVSIVEVRGVIGSGWSDFEKMLGCIDVREIRATIDAASRTSELIILDIDSPGGMVQGTPELADYIADLSETVPMMSFTSGQMCSAAYWIGCATGKVFSTKTAEVGSIGCYMQFLDASEAFKDAGLKVEMITSGKFKGMGAFGTSLTDDQRKELQDKVNEIAGSFSDHVIECRKTWKLDTTCFDGRVFNGQKAVDVGLVDSIVSDIYECPANAVR